LNRSSEKPVSSLLLFKCNLYRYVKGELEATRAKLHAAREGNGGGGGGGGGGGFHDNTTDNTTARGSERKKRGADAGVRGSGSGRKSGSNRGGSFFGRLAGGGGGAEGGGGGEDGGGGGSDSETESSVGPSTPTDGGAGALSPFLPRRGAGEEEAATTALLLEEASRLKAQVEAADEARDEVAGQLSQATKEKLEALVELAQEGRVGTFHVIQSITRVMGWHFSRYFAVKTRFN
jgi:hypothetical protein